MSVRSTRWGSVVAAAVVTACGGDDFVAGTAATTTTTTTAAGTGGASTITGAGGGTTGGGGAATGAGGAGGATTTTAAGGAGGTTTTTGAGGATTTTGAGGAGGAGGTTTTTGAGGAGGASPPPTLCQKHPNAILCDDFESPSYLDVNAVVKTWNGALGGNGQIALIGAANAPSPTHALQASVGKNGEAYLMSSALATPAGKVRVEYAVRNDGLNFSALGPVKVVTLAGLAIGAQPSPGTIYLYVGPSGLGVGATPLGLPELPLAYDLGEKIGAGVWSRWGFVVDFANGTVQALKNGNPVGASKALHPSLKVPANTPMTFGVGVTRTVNVDAATLAYDDVVVATP